MAKQVDSPPTVTVAICTRDRCDRLARCLSSIVGVTMPEGFPASHLSILVVDNAPSDGQTRALVSQYGGVMYVCESKPGLDFARNRALKVAPGAIIAYIDDDVTVDPGWLRGLLDACRACPGAAAFTGQVLPYQVETEAQVLFERRGGFRKGSSRAVLAEDKPSGSLSPPAVVSFGVGANMAFVKEALERIGGFDEALDTGPPLPGGGDLDIFYRIVHAGYALVYEPSFLVYHEHRREMSALRRQYYGWGMSFMAYARKTCQIDSAEKKKLKGTVWWWLKYQSVCLFRGLLGRREYRPDLVLAELAGGAIGFFGEYERSVQRVEKIRESFPS